jgi:hypothetical protein
MKKISTKSIEQYPKQEKIKILPIKLDNFELEVQVKTSLTVQELIQFETSIVDSVINENGYFPSLFSYIFNSSVIQFFTNINLPTDLDKKYDIIVNTDLVDKILDIIGIYVLDLECEIRDKIEYQKQIILQSANPLDSVAKNINDLLATLNTKIEKTDINKMLKTVEKLDPNKFQWLKGVTDLWNNAEKTGDYSEIIGKEETTESQEV